jgi:hypothetical protein
MLMMKKMETAVWAALDCPRPDKEAFVELGIYILFFFVPMLVVGGRGLADYSGA